jgi:hypothetical protein
VRRHTVQSGRLIKQTGRRIKYAAPIGLPFDRQLESREPKPGSSIKRYERAIILLSAKGRQEEAHEHVVDVRKGDRRK